MLIVGEKEAEAETVSVRRRDDGENQDLGSMTIAQLFEVFSREDKA